MTVPTQGRAIAITGGSRGIGLATAHAFLAAGARVAICARDRAHLEQAQRALGAADRVYARPVDVTDARALRRFIDAASTALGAIDVLVNNAGVLHVGPYADEPYESIDALIDVNLKGVMYGTRAVLPAMLVRGSGVIVNVASGAGLTAFPDIVSYCASKFGVVGFSAALHEELRGSGVRVHALCPGRVATGMQAQYAGAKIGMAPERVAERILAIAEGKGSRQAVITLG
jgi:3-oxoacyl-[acyl-carrier protein] reductase